MVKEIVVPESILEDIARDGTKEAAKGREANGNIVGYYDSVEDTIFVQQRYIEPSKRGLSTLSSRILNRLHLAVSMPKFLRAYWLEDEYHTRTRNDGLIPALVNYHSHPYGSWSPKDIGATQDYEKNLRNNQITKDVKFASLLYIARQNAFLAIDGYGNNITVSISTK